MSWANDYGINPDEIIRMHKGGKTVRFDTDSGGQTTSGAVKVAGQADVDKLPKGTKFTWTDGKQYTKD